MGNTIAHPNHKSPARKGRCIIFDLDGTCSDTAHRQHLLAPGGIKKDWDAFFDAARDDTPFEHIRLLTRMAASYAFMMESANAEPLHVVYVTGRPERSRKLTDFWLHKHKFAHGPIFMRADGDYRPDHIVKAELLVQVRHEGYEPIMVFDDRAQVVAMWRAMGIPCAQVAEGSF